MDTSQWLTLTVGSQAAFHVGPGWAPVGQSWAPNGPQMGPTGAHLGMLLGVLGKKHDELISETLASLPSVDQNWVRRRGESSPGPPRGKHQAKRDKSQSESEGEETEIEYVTSYHVLGLGWSSDVKHNHKMIRVMHKAITNNQDDLNELVNRTELVFKKKSH